MYLFLGVANSASSSVSSLLWNSFAGSLFEILIILSAILLPIKSPVDSAVFDAVFIASVLDFFTLSRSFWLYLLLKFLVTLFTCLPMLLAKDKNSYHFTYILSGGSIEYLIFICYFHLITKVKFILSSSSNGLLFCSVNHIIISSYSELKVFKKI